jgi:GNAT superfamily N-acetyltransferase
MYQEYRNGKFLVSTDPGKLDLEAIHEFLSKESYWAKGIPKEIMRRAIENSLCFGVYENSQQIGFARIITDHATFAYLCDVYILETHRGKGLAKWLMSTIMAHPSIQGLRRINLVTRDAHRLYKQFGFTAPNNPDGYMELVRRDIYQSI